MFNRTYVVPRSPDVHVHVQQPDPVDASDAARLLKDLEEKAEQKIIDTIRLEDNGFNAVVHVMQMPISYDVRLVCVFDLNGMKETATVDVGMDSSPSDAVKRIMEEVSQIISSRMLVRAFEPINYRDLPFKNR